MKTSKVINEIEKMGLRTEIIGHTLFVYNHEMWTIASIKLERKFEINTNSLTFGNELTKDEIEKVYFLLTKLAETDPKDRKEPQKFYLKFEALTDNGSGTYLNYYKSGDSLGMSTRYQSFGFQTEFTQKEIDEIKEKFGVTLSDFIQIPVDEYWEE